MTEEERKIYLAKAKTQEDINLVNSCLSDSMREIICDKLTVILGLNSKRHMVYIDDCLTVCDCPENVKYCGYKIRILKKKPLLENISKKSIRNFIYDKIKHIPGVMQLFIQDNSLEYEDDALILRQEALQEFLEYKI